MLTVSNLQAKVEDGVDILKGIDLSVRPGEIHAIMGPNGSGKSTLSKVVAGHPAYEVTGGSVVLDTGSEKKNLLELDPPERALEGIFMAFQYPVEVPGVNNQAFLHAAYNERRRYRGEADMDIFSFNKLLKEKMKLLRIDEKFINRSVNTYFSGGEKKRNEILQMAVLDPKVMFLDETDSGLDIDSLRIVADGINTLRSSENAVVLITHYQRLLNYVVPDFVHILSNGKIVASGDKSLALQVEEKGYDWIKAA